MDRKQFLKACAAGACACAAPCVPAAAEPVKEDWRFGFVKRRYAKLVSLLSETMSRPELERTLFKLGAFCSSEYEAKLKSFNGSIAAFAEDVRKSSSGDIITVDEKTGVITMTTPERADCWCPLHSLTAKTPEVACSCSLGWQTHSWETLLGKKVTVEVKEAVLRGGKHCTFVIRPVEKT